MKDKQYILMILDGVGINKEKKGNAIISANTPNLDMILKKYPNTEIEASGLAVGLPEGQMGNSEVGHMTLGLGDVLYQDLTRIDCDIKDGNFFKNEELLKACNHVKNNNSKLHVMGLLSDGGVHSSNKHLYAILKLAKEQNINEVYIHCFLDGRDVPPKSSILYITSLQEKINEIGIGKISSVCGRYYAMDRDNRWDRVEQAYNTLTSIQSTKISAISRNRRKL